MELLEIRVVETNKKRFLNVIATLIFARWYSVLFEKALV